MNFIAVHFRTKKLDAFMIIRDATCRSNVVNAAMASGSSKDAATSAAISLSILQAGDQFTSV